MKKTFFLLSFMSVLFLSVFAQRPKIVEYIERNSNVKINQSTAIDNLIDKYLNEQEKENPVSEKFGYRVQVFSSNNQRVAKKESETVRNKLRTAFPGVGVYRMFLSPFWKVRVGSFNSREDAQAFCNRIKRKFPELSRTSYVVRERRKK